MTKATQAEASMHVTTFSQAQAFLLSHTPQSIGATFPGAKGLERTIHLLDLLGNPQQKLKVIHIAGTSGKGSSAYLLSIMLKALGFSVGLHLSPYISDLREGFQISNRLINKEEFCAFLNEIRDAIDRVKQSPLGSPTYFEILIALVFYTFYRKGVDFAVIETGLGGSYDATNAASAPDKLCLITKIGFDHTRILGDTLAKIAFHKAMIMHKGNVALSVSQKTNAKKMIEKVAKEQRATPFFLEKNVSATRIRAQQKETVFDFSFRNLTLQNIRLGLIGAHQAENCALALGAVVLLSERHHFAVDENHIRAALANAHLPGRMEIVKSKKGTIIIDGAHNPQKMAALSRGLKKFFPEKTFHFLIAFKKGKDYIRILDYIVPLAKTITLTSCSPPSKSVLVPSVPPAKVAAALAKRGFSNYRVVFRPREALNMCLKDALSPLVVTGSLYLIGNLYPVIPHLRQKNQNEAIRGIGGVALDPSYRR